MSALREIYTQQIARRGYKSDAVQLAVVDKLEELRSQLIAAHSRGGLRRWLSSRTASKAGVRGLYLWGGVGRGKTWLMDLFYQSLPFPQRRRRHFHRFMHDVHAELRSLGEIEAPLEQVAERISREARVLCFDELFVSDIADAMILGGLFDALFRRGVTLVVTSNVPPRDLYKNGLQRDRFLPFIELVKQRLEVLELGGGQDYRMERLRNLDVYLTPLGAWADKKLDEAFRAMTDGADGEPRVLRTQGRDVEVPRAAPGCAMAHFLDWCAKPMGAADFLCIAEHFHTVILAEIPKMGPDNRDKAARFVTMIDSFYEKKVKFVCSAATSPDKLYIDGDGAFEFQRTVSRLMEMQSPEYLALDHIA